MKTRLLLVAATGAMILAMATSAMATRKSTYFIINDHLGTPQAMTDTTGKVVWKADYEPYGAVTVNEDPDGDGKKVVLNLRFPGQYYDAETGWMYNWHRYYDQETGRYLQADPISRRDYLFVRNNPLMFFDRNGLLPEEFGCAGGSWGGEGCKIDFSPLGMELQVELACACVVCTVNYTCKTRMPLLGYARGSGGFARAGGFDNGKGFSGKTTWTSVEMYENHIPWYAPSLPYMGPANYVQYNFAGSINYENGGTVSAQAQAYGVGISLLQGDEVPQCAPTKVRCRDLVTRGNYTWP